MDERFTVLPKWPGYGIGDRGTIVGPYGRPLACKPDVRGYPRFTVRDLKAHKYRFVEVHKAVAAAWLPEPPSPEHTYVAHWDDNPRNNAVGNLRWATHAGNMRDAVRNGRNHWANKTHCPQNHPYDQRNTRHYRGFRYCNECHRERTLERTMTSRRQTTMGALTEGLRQAGFEPKTCAHQHVAHTSWEYRPQGGTTRGRLPLYVVHLDRSGAQTIAHGFAFGGPADTDEHWKGRFTSLTRALNWAIEHGRRADR